MLEEEQDQRLDVAQQIDANRTGPVTGQEADGSDIYRRPPAVEACLAGTRADDAPALDISDDVSPLDLVRFVAQGECAQSQLS